MTAWGCTGLRVAYGPLVAVDGIDLSLDPGEVTAVVGGDGAGKTTLLSALAGARRPAAGQVRRPPARWLGVVTASGGSYGDLTVEENLRFAADIYRIGARERRQRMADLLERIGLGGARDRRGDQLSGGMRQKLAVAMALLARPLLLVLDEPTTGIDPRSRAELWRLIAEAAAGGAAVLLSTTYLDEAERAEHILVMHAGRALLSGTASDIIASVPGRVVQSRSRPPDDSRWRRAGVWCSWRPQGDIPDWAEPRTPDLEDATVVAMLAAAEGTR